MSDPIPDEQRQFFEARIWPHLTAAYNFARWLVRDHHQAEEIVQESFVKALRGSASFRGSDVRPWLFAIVRNSAMNLMTRTRNSEPIESAPDLVDPAPDPELSLERTRRQQQVRAAIARLPIEFREALVLREMEGMAYKEIAAALRVPLGTVMSRLARARQLLIQELLPGDGESK